MYGCVNITNYVSGAVVDISQVWVRTRTRRSVVSRSVRRPRGHVVGMILKVDVI